MNIFEISQDENRRIFQTKYTVDWLVSNTNVKTFDPIKFEGYQRQFDEKHARKIIDYVSNNAFYFPTAIICSSDKKTISEEISSLSIVDGQHRVAAFRIIMKENPTLYDRIKQFEIPVIILLNPELKTEIETFITINKTSKKVDTSLAYVLKNMINKDSTDEISNTARKEYLSVEVARKLNSEQKYSLWYEKILYEGSTRNRFEFITLNGFVKSMRALLGELDKSRIISCYWDSSYTENDLRNKIEILADLVEFVWDMVYIKWPELKTETHENERVVQGTIGFTTINRFLIIKTREMNVKTLQQYKEYIRDIINQIDIPAERWKKGGLYSKFTSESGYRTIVEDLLGNGIK